MYSSGFYLYSLIFISSQLNLAFTFQGGLFPMVINYFNSLLQCIASTHVEAFNSVFFD